jgi:uncharacterized protein YkwD
VRSARHALSAAALAALALGGLTARNDLDIAALQTAAHATGTPASPAQRAPDAATTAAADRAVRSSAAAPTTTSRSAHTTPQTAASTQAMTQPTTKPTSKSATTSVGSTAAKPAASSVAGQILGLVNGARIKAGCKPVSLDGRLTAAAAGHAQDMAANDYFSHTSKDDRTFVDRIKDQGYAAPRSENIAAGQPSVTAVMDAWMASSGHRANILDCTATQMGAASAKGGTYGVYWVQDFGRGGA